MYRLILKDEQGFTFCYYSATTTEHFNSVIKSLTDKVTWEIQYHG